MLIIELLCLLRDGRKGFFGRRERNFFKNIFRVQFLGHLKIYICESENELKKCFK